MEVIKIVTVTINSFQKAAPTRHEQGVGARYLVTGYAKLGHNYKLNASDLDLKSITALNIIPKNVVYTAWGSISKLGTEDNYASIRMASLTWGTLTTNAGSAVISLAGKQAGSAVYCDIQAWGF